MSFNSPKTWVGEWEESKDFKVGSWSRGKSISTSEKSFVIKIFSALKDYSKINK